MSGLLDWAVSDTPALEGLPSAEALARRDHAELVVAGGYPEMRDLPVRSRRNRLRDHLQTIVDRDLADVLQVRRTDAFRRAIEQVAVRTGGVLNVSDPAGLVGVTRTTLDQYLDVLERLAVVIRVGAWACGETRREAGRPKMHMVDTGLACALRGREVASFDADADPTAFGGLLESFVFNEFVRAAPLQQAPFSLWHWTGREGREIDVVAESRRRLVAVEIKASSSVSQEDLRHLRWFAQSGPARGRRVTSILLYLGAEPVTLGERVFALPVSMLWGTPKG